MCVLGAKPLSYYVSQSDSRTYNTVPLETV